jgi:hypothetical protein
MYDFDSGKTLWVFRVGNADGSVGFIGTSKKSDNNNVPDIVVIEKYSEKPPGGELHTTSAAGVCGISRKVKELTCNVVFHNEDQDQYGAANFVAHYSKFETLNNPDASAKWH